MTTHWFRSWWRPRQFGVPGIKVSLVVGVAAALVLRLAGIGPPWITMILAPSWSSCSRGPWRWSPGR